MHRCLAAHPDVFMSETKELEFFTRGRARDVEGYKEHFRESGSALYRGESTPAYLWSIRAEAATVANRVKNLLGQDVRLIVCLRQPVQRAVSAYMHHWRMGRIRGEESLVEVARGHGIEETGHYCKHLSQWLEVYDRKNFIFLISDDLRSHPDASLALLFKTLGLRHVDVDAATLSPQNHGFALKVDKGTVTVDMASRDKLNKRLCRRRFPRMQPGFRIPCIARDDLRDLERRYVADIEFVESEIAGKPLGWAGKKPLDFYAR